MNSNYLNFVLKCHAYTSRHKRNFIFPKSFESGSIFVQTSLRYLDRAGLMPNYAKDLVHLRSEKQYLYLVVEIWKETGWCVAKFLILV